MATLDILYFAWVREGVGLGSERVTLPDSVIDVAGAIDWLATRSAGHAGALADKRRLRAALDQKFVGLDAGIAGMKELALFPPVTGG